MLEKDKVKIGCSPISWMSDDDPELAGKITWQQTLSEIALGGYEGYELGSAYPMDVDILRKESQLRGVQLCNAWFSMRFTSRPMEETIERFKRHLAFMKAMGANVIGAGECGVTIHLSSDIPLYTALPTLSGAQFEALARGMNECGRLAAAEGITFAIHPHIGTGVQTQKDIDKVMDMTDPKLVKLVLDTGHIAAAGDSPTHVVEKYIARTALMHVKDARSHVIKKMKAERLSFIYGVKEGMFTVPGDGDMVDWEEIFQILDRNHFAGWIVVEAEQDPLKANPLEYTMMARKFIRDQIGL